MTSKPGLRGRWVDWGVFLPSLAITITAWTIIITAVRLFTN